MYKSNYWLPEQPCDKEEDPNWGVGWGFDGAKEKEKDNSDNE